MPAIDEWERRKRHATLGGPPVQAGPADVESVKRNADLVELVTQRLGPPDRASAGAPARYWWRCPFHDERTPSFSVSVERQLRYCHGCGRGDEAITWLRQTYGSDFGEALRFLAPRGHGRGRIRGISTDD